MTKTFAPEDRVTIDAVGFRAGETGRVIAVSKRTLQFTIQVVVETTEGDPGPYLFSADELTRKEAVDAIQSD